MLVDNNQSWQSEGFKNMLEYERNNDREKFIYDVNQLITSYSNLNDKESLEYLNLKDDPQLLALVFSLISITYNKDDLSNYIKNEDLSDYMHPLIEGNDEFLTPVYGHTFRRFPEKNLEIGEQFTIPDSTLTIDYISDLGKPERSFNLDEWDFIYDSSIISINNKTITALKKGCTIIDCVNKKYNVRKKIKINSGNVKQSHITEFFFTQIRNIIAHGRYTILNSGLYDTLSELGRFNMPTSDNRYKRGSQRELFLFENNQLNVAYDKNNTINPKYVIHLAETLYAKEGNPYVKFIDMFDNSDFFYTLKRKIEALSESGKETYNLLMLLSKFYINFIYNYDSYDKDNFNYDVLPIDFSLKGNLTNQEFIYEIRTAIMHGRYDYRDSILHFWNYDKKDSSITTFDVSVPESSFLLIILSKEIEFYKGMKYNPDKLAGIK